MTLHGIKEYIVYRWKAMGRHGVHSPFAYKLVDTILPQCKTAVPTGVVNACSWLPKPYKTLATGLLQLLALNNVMLIENELQEPDGQYDMLILNSSYPGQWVRLFNRYIGHLKPNSVFIITGIHNTHRHTTKWNRLCRHPKVMMSVDLYGVGLIFFRDEFKEKQHFVLRY